MGQQPPENWEAQLSNDMTRLSMGSSGGGRGGVQRGAGGLNFNPRAQSFVPQATAQPFVPGQAYTPVQGFVPPGGWSGGGYAPRPAQRWAGHDNQFYAPQQPQQMPISNANFMPQGQGLERMPMQQPTVVKSSSSEGIQAAKPDPIPPLAEKVVVEEQAKETWEENSDGEEGKVSEATNIPDSQAAGAETNTEQTAAGPEEGSAEEEPAAAVKESGTDMESEPGTEQDEESIEKDTDKLDIADADSDAAKVGKKTKRKVVIDEKEHINVLFFGHVDAGKSTLGGQIMYLTGSVDKRTLDKYEKEAREMSRESWYLSWCMDTNAEEREKGKTVEVGRAYFSTPKKRFTVLDAPGHKSFVPNMIAGATQADIGILVISARKGEFEAGFDKGGQTREHAMLAKTAGIKYLVVLINKMDDPSVNWDSERYNEIVTKLTPFLRKTGYNLKDVYFLPASGQTGANVLEPLEPGVFDQYQGPPLLTVLDDLKPIERNNDGPVRLPIIEKFKDMGTMVLGKLESGTLCRGDVLTLMPNKVTAEVSELYIDDVEQESAGSGSNLRLKLRNVDENDVHVGFVLCDPEHLVPTVRVFDAQLVILEVESIVCAGFTCVLHIHAAAEEVKFQTLIATIDRKTGGIAQRRPRFVKQDQVIIARLETQSGAVCMELFKQFPQLGRFTLRDKGRTVAIGKIVKLVA